MKTRHVVFCSDARGVPFLRVSLHSLLASAMPASMIVHVLYAGEDFDEKVKDAVRAVVSGYPFATLAFHDVAKNFARHPGAFEKRMVFARMFICECIAEDANVVYLDTDVLVLRDLEPLFDMDMGDGLFAAVSEAERTNGVCDPGDCAFFAEGASFYFNAGVMVFNLRQYRAEALDRAIAWYQENWSRCKAYDQDVLNAISVGHVIRLPLKWNYGDGWLARSLKCGTGGRTWRGNLPSEVWEAIRNPAIVHYVGPRKPWRKSHRPLRRLYHAHMRKLGWDPPADPLWNVFYDIFHWFLFHFVLPLRFCGRGPRIK